MSQVLFTNKIKKLREEKGLSQTQLAERLKVNKSQICRYESGEQAPTSETLRSLARIFGVSIEDIMNGPENKKYNIDDSGRAVVDYSDGRRAKGSVFSQTDTHSLTIYPDGFKFSTGCVRKWEDITHVAFVTVDSKKMLVIEMSDSEDFDAQRWCNMSKGKKYGRKITARPYAEEIYKLMEWSKGYIYKIDGMIGVNKNNMEQEVWAFDLESASMYPMTEKARIKAGVRNEELKTADIQLLDRIEELPV